MSHSNKQLIVDKIQREISAILKTEQWELLDIQKKCNYSEKLDVGKYCLRLSGAKPTIVATFELHPMVNCCGICVSTSASVQPDYRKRGLGTLLNRLRMDIARHNGYSLLLCTDVMDNTPQRRVLERNGWKDIYRFVNRRTGNPLYISVINL